MYPLPVRLLFCCYLFLVLFITSTTAPNNKEETNKPEVDDFMSVVNSAEDFNSANDDSRFKICVLSNLEAFVTISLHPLFWFSEGFGCLQSRPKCLHYSNSYNGLSICGHQDRVIETRNGVQWKELVESEYKYQLGDLVRSSEYLSSHRLLFCKLGIIPETVSGYDQPL
eukprot:GHVS01060423.1.p1 GENE.GHVS01060423.1~~GHVS01060423.1.p1  ORF type:complete len:169 (+),score=13.86 GHVS01060423.1:116-622(+)